MVSLSRDKLTGLFGISIWNGEDDDDNLVGKALLLVPTLASAIVIYLGGCFATGMSELTAGSIVDIGLRSAAPASATALVAAASAAAAAFADPSAR